MAIEWADVLQGAITIASIAAGIFGVLGKRRYRKIARVIIGAIEEVDDKRTKRKVSSRMELKGMGKHMDREIERETGRRVRSKRKN